MKLTKNDIEKLLPYRSRGLDELARRVGDIRPIIDKKLKKKKIIRVLEIGFGFGGCIMELRKRYGNRVEIYGVNKFESHGDWDVMKRVAIKKKLFTKNELSTMEKPTLLYYDVSKGLPFKKDYFDVVYSQVSFMYFDDKAKVIEEVNRVLAKDGIARLDIQEMAADAPAGYDVLFEIWNGDHEIFLWNHLKKFRSLTKRKAPKRSYLEMRKTKKLDLGLRLMHVINYNTIWPTRYGRKSIYTTK